MADEVRRLRYFNGFFLQDSDFIEEQNYHRRMRYLHNRWLHNWGIVQGLQVTEGPGSKQVTVSSGAALLKIVESGEELSKEVALVSNSLPIDIPGSANQEVYIVLTADYDVPAEAQQVEPHENTRYVERATVSALPPGSPTPNNEDTLILAKITLNSAGNGIDNKDESDRIYAGAVISGAEMNSITFRVPGISTNLPTLFGAKVGASQVKGLKLENSERVEMSGDLDVENQLNAMTLAQNNVTIDTLINGEIDAHINDVNAHGTVIDGKIDAHKIDANAHATLLSTNQYNALTGGASSDASAYHTHLTIDPVERIYSVPLIAVQAGYLTSFVTHGARLATELGMPVIYGGLIPLHLPDGTTLINVTASVSTVAVATFPELNIFLCRSEHTAEIEEPICEIQINTPSDVTQPCLNAFNSINNNLYSYYFRMLIDMSTHPSTLIYLQGLKVTYEISSSLP